MAQPRKSLAQRLCVDRSTVYVVIARLSIDYLHWIKTRRIAYGDRVANCCHRILHETRKLEPEVAALSAAACRFDFDDKIPGNGYRSLVAVVDTCLLHLIRLLGRIVEQRNSFVFLLGHYCREIEIYTSILGILREGVHYAKQFVTLSPDSNLFPTEENAELESLMQKVESLEQNCFYGRCIGFQFCSSLTRPFHIVAIGMAAFSDGYAMRPKNQGGLIRTAVSLLSSGKYIWNPERRAERIVSVTRHATIDFCKAFWSISETDFLRRLSNIQSPELLVNDMVDIPVAGGSIFLPDVKGGQVEISIPSCHSGPRPIPARLFSSVVREGMDELIPRLAGIVEAPTPRSANLVFHCHGGGFVAQSSKSHEIYLKTWAKMLNAPLLSIDYSLAPEDPFPRAQHELVYAYAWCLKNAQLLGWTGEKICFAGDSAGGNLLTATALRLISAEVKRLPDGLVLIYTPFMISYTPSPSRFLCLMDPLLPLGILARCMEAYTGFKADDLPVGWPELDVKTLAQQKKVVEKPKRKLSYSSRQSATLSTASYTTCDVGNSSPTVVKVKACRTQNIEYVESHKSSGSSTEDQDGFVSSLTSPTTPDSQLDSAFKDIDNHQVDTDQPNSSKGTADTKKGSEILSYVRFQRPSLSQNGSGNSLPSPVEPDVSPKIHSVRPHELLSTTSSIASYKTSMAIDIREELSNQNSHRPDGLRQDWSPKYSARMVEATVSNGSDSVFGITEHVEYEEDVDLSANLLGSIYSVARDSIKAVVSYAVSSPSPDIYSDRTIGSTDSNLNGFADSSVEGSQLLQETEAQVVENNVGSDTFSEGLPYNPDANQSLTQAKTSVASRMAAWSSPEGLTTVQIQKDPAKICLSCESLQGDELLRFLGKDQNPMATANPSRVRRSRSSQSDSCSTDVTAAAATSKSHEKQPLRASHAVSLQSNSSTSTNEDGNEFILQPSMRQHQMPQKLMRPSYSVGMLEKLQQSAGSLVSGISSVVWPTGSFPNDQINGFLDAEEMKEEFVDAHEENHNGDGTKEQVAFDLPEDSDSNEEADLNEPNGQPEAKRRERTTIRDPFLSPMYASDEVLQKMPPTFLIACHLDPLLDDSVMFARKLKAANVRVNLDLLDSLPHGFLNFTLYSRECKLAAKLCVQRIRDVLKGDGHRGHETAEKSSA